MERPHQRPTATVTGLGLADAEGSFVTRSLSRLELGFDGLAGDRHAGATMCSGPRQPWLPKGTVLRNSRQLSLVGVEELQQVAEALSVPVVQWQWQWLGANLCLEGVARLTELPPSSRLLFPSGAAVAIDGVNHPCVGPGRRLAEALGGDQALAGRFVKAAVGRRGLVGWVERPGVIEVGDVVQLILPEERR